MTFGDSKGLKKYSIKMFSVRVIWRVVYWPKVQSHPYQSRLMHLLVNILIVLPSILADILVCCVHIPPTHIIESSISGPSVRCTWDSSLFREVYMAEWQITGVSTTLSSR